MTTLRRTRQVNRVIISHRVLHSFCMRVLRMVLKVFDYVMEESWGTLVNLCLASPHCNSVLIQMIVVIGVASKILPLSSSAWTSWACASPSCHWFFHLVARSSSCGSFNFVWEAEPTQRCNLWSHFSRSLVKKTKVWLTRHVQTKVIQSLRDWIKWTWLSRNPAACVLLQYISVSVHYGCYVVPYYITESFLSLSFDHICLIFSSQYYNSVKTSNDSALLD